uniref:DDE_Tnp_1_7 domain-containing protein n=1 Tax=Heterorhabditis bacteriophora TaxID=37862 RepID=A0A1I7W920_HETBA
MIIEVKLSERAQETRGKITFITLNTARQRRKTNRIRYNGAMESLAADHSPSCRPSCVILNLVARALWNVSIDERNNFHNRDSVLIVTDICACIPKKHHKQFMETSMLMVGTTSRYTQMYLHMEGFHLDATLHYFAHWIALKNVLLMNNNYDDKDNNSLKQKGTLICYCYYSIKLT